MATLSLTTTSLSAVKTDALVIGLAQTDRGPVLAPGAEDIDKAFKKKLLPALVALGATGAAGEVTKLATLGATTAPVVVAVGLGGAPGRGTPYDGEVLRRGVGTAVRTLAGTARVATALAAAGGPEGVRAVAEGALLGAYAFRTFRTVSATAATTPVAAITLVVDSTRDKAVKAAVARAEAVTAGVAWVRDHVNTPPGNLHPADLAAAAAALCKDAGCTVEIFDEKALAKGGPGKAHGGILGVGQGSANPPRLVRIAYTPSGRTRATVHLVGKGITFDSGGLSLKPAAAMEWMKSDMGGAATVAATVATAARLGLDVTVVGWLCIAENMPSGAAIRPSDVLVMRGGKTVEVLNTDAEGRLVMADGIVRAAEEGADVIVDVATLTGAQLVALGTRVFAVMGNDDPTRDAIVSAAGRAGEQAWPMPLPPELRKSLDSDVADIANIGDRNGGMLTAGLFLKEFVPDGIRWAHLDIAGPAFNEGEEHDYTPKGGTGVPVRSLVEWLESVTA